MASVTGGLCDDVKQYRSQFGEPPVTEKVRPIARGRLERGRLYDRVRE
jgi:hypothetical protein